MSVECARDARVECIPSSSYFVSESRKVELVLSVLNPYRNSLQMPSHASPSDVVAMPNLRLRMPNIDLLARIWARCRSSCALPEK